MLGIDPKWGQTPQSLLERVISAEDPHLRRRFLALYFIASGDSGVAAAAKVGRCRAQVAKWVRKFNESGPQALVSGWQGNPGKTLEDEELALLKEIVSRPPQEAGLNAARWTSGLVAALVERTFGKKLHPETTRKYLKELGFNYRKPDKILVKADRLSQLDFLEKLDQLGRERSTRNLTAFADEGQLRQDALTKKGWYLKNRATAHSNSPGK
ncbi:MAG: winged helix-turn-helix domain-containing protein [Desulfocurvibacter africanus]